MNLVVATSTESLLRCGLVIAAQVLLPRYFASVITHSRVEYAD